MKQHSISLDSQSIAVLDELEKMLKIPKAKLMKQAINQMKTKFANVFVLKKKESQVSYKHFDKLVGVINLKTDKPTNYAQEDDDFYLKD